MKRLCGILILPALVAVSVSACNVNADNAAKRVDAVSFKTDEATGVKSTDEEKTEDPQSIAEYKKLYEAMKVNPSLNQISYESKLPEGLVEEEQLFPGSYTDIEGILTFRGNNYRNTAAWGRVKLQEARLEKLWDFNTSYSSFGGGGGWTGQPAVIRWPEEIREIMNIKDKFKAMQGFTEVIFASLDGRIYFFELNSGEQTREPIDIKNTIKGSVSVDPRGFPLLYAGQGINESGKLGFRIFSLIDGRQLYFLSGYDSFAYRGWGAFDGSPLINGDTDTMIIGGENGLLYRIKLNTDFRPRERSISVSPEVSKYHYKIEGSRHQGIENSIAVYGDTAYFADNSGSVQAVNLSSLKPLWTAPKTDDTDAAIAVSLENDIPYLYTGCEVDKQGKRGMSTIRKINGMTGEIVWAKEYPCYSILGENPINGGMLASAAVGKNAIEGSVIFTLARYGDIDKGLMIALDCKDGSELWRWEMQSYSWSSPVDIYDEEGNAYIVQGDSAGRLHLLDGKSGAVFDVINLNANIESSPVVFENTIVVTTRGGKVYGIRIK
ncbi:MAG: hypothetical protein K0R84_352 [Clostridia bacterium]|jgi:hypothetical protein|nr:hypothetical protein [Clostridia bacterium]